MGVREIAYAIGEADQEIASCFSNSGEALADGLVRLGGVQLGADKPEQRSGQSCSQWSLSRSPLIVCKAPLEGCGPMARSEKQRSF